MSEARLDRIDRTRGGMLLVAADMPLTMARPRSDIWYLYIVRCADGSLYTGIARDVQARIALHDAGKGARYTRGRGPLTLCAVRRCRSKGTALSLEHAVKQLSRVEKERLIEPGRLSRLRIARPR